MADKTDEMYDLVRDVLRRFSQPYGEDITEDIFVTIENDKELLKRYELLKARYTSTNAINAQMGKASKELTGLKAGRTADARRTRLIETYTKLY